LLNVVVNPRDDTGFVALVDEVAPGTRRPQDLEALLRKRYPRAVVRARGLSGEIDQIWYVYRDGSWTSGAEASRTG
jgi:hypothetical protein